jgi:hypothetical protein
VFQILKDNFFLTRVAKRRLPKQKSNFSLIMLTGTVVPGTVPTNRVIPFFIWPIFRKGPGPKIILI